MKIVLRWFGPGQDPVPLEHILQIPGISGIAGCLLDIPTGEVWPRERVRALAGLVNSAGLEFEVVESLNVHEDIKLGLPTRDRLIEAYLESMGYLAEVGVRVICYNFMGVFDWFRTDLRHKLEDGSEVLHYDGNQIKTLSPETILDRMINDPQGVRFPGYEPGQQDRIKDLFEAYAGLSEEDIRKNLAYFLDAVVPRAEELGMRFALHPDDPPWSIFGLPRISKNRNDLRANLDLNSSPANGLTLCSGSLGADKTNDIPAMVREFGGEGRIPFAHLRNIKHTHPGIFAETSHLSSDGSLDLFEILKAYKETGFDGYLRPDHGRMIWGEKGRPGYGLYDRALGIAYINGIWEALDKMGSGE